MGPEVGNELEQAALAKVYEGIVALQAAKSLKQRGSEGGVGKDVSGGKPAVEPGSLDEATNNLIKAFAMPGSRYTVSQLHVLVVVGGDCCLLLLLSLDLCC